MERAHTTIARRRTGLAGLAVALATVIASEAARADQQYDFKLRLAPDQQWSFQQTSSFSMDAKKGNGAGQEMHQSTAQKRSGTVTVLAAKDGTPSSLKIAFGADCGQSASQNGQHQDQPFPLAGKTVRVKKDDLGILQIDGAATDPATTTELGGLLTPDRSFFPTHPVAVGDTWTGDAATVGKELSFGPNDAVTVNCRLARIGTVDGRPTADVTIAVVGTKADNGVTMKMTLDGTAQADLATGQTLQADLTGTLDLAGQGNAPDGGQAVSGGGKLEMHQSVRPVAGVAAAAAATPAEPNPLAGGGGNNPLAAPVADRFAGTYKNERISVQLQPAADGYTGTIAMGDRKFPAVAHADRDRLTGTFDAGGNKFDFSATLSGNALQMASGQNNFTLRKEPPPNPLDAVGGDAPVNPLAPR